MTGYVKAQRSRFDHHLFRSEKFCRGYAWDWLVANAAYKPRQVDVKGETITLERGQLCMSVRFIGKAWGWDRSAVSRFLDRLRRENMIRTEAETGQTIIAICNYDEYQGEDKPARDKSETGARQGRDSTETPPRQKRDKLEEGKEGKKVKKGEGSDKSDPPPTEAGEDFDFEDHLADALGLDGAASLPPMWRNAKGRAHVAAWLETHEPEHVIAVIRESRKKHPEPPASPQAIDPHLAKPPAAAPARRAEPIETARFWAEKIVAGKFIAASSVRPDIARLMLAEGLVTEDQLREKGIAA